MFHTRPAFVLAALAVAALLAGCKPNTAPEPVKSAVLGGEADGDPAEKDALKFLKDHGGLITLDESQSNLPVIKVGLFDSPGLTDADVRILATLKKLQTLTIMLTKVTGVGLRDFAGCRDLTELNVSNNQIGDEGMKEVGTLTQLKALHLNGLKAREASVKELAPLKNLVELHLATAPQIGDRAAAIVAADLPQLRQLSLDNTAVGDAGVAELAKMPHLQLLTLNGTKVTDKGLEALGGSKTLEHLQLSGVTDASCAALARCKSVRRLRLSDTTVTDKGLAEVGKLPNLNELELYRSGIANEAIIAFKKAHPNVTVKQ